MGKKKRYVHKGISLPIVLIAITLTCIGLVMVFGTTYNTALNKDKNAFDAIKFQALVAVLGVICMFFISRIDYHFFMKPRVLLSGMAVCALMLISVFFFAPTYDSHRWIRLSSFTIQPSDIAKFIIIIYVSFYCSTKKWWYRSFREWVGLLLPVGVLAGLILIEPDLSTTLCILGTVVIIMFVSGMQWKWLLGGVVAMACILCIRCRFRNLRLGYGVLFHRTCGCLCALGNCCWHSAVLIWLCRKRW